jgi:predicted RecA/RadA family phage recombinase
MAFFQIPRIPVNPDGTVSMYNYSGTDIPAALVVAFDSTNLPDPTSATGKAGYGCTLPGADGAYLVGVTIETIKAGAAGRVMVDGVAPVTVNSSAGVTAGQVLMAENATGCVKTQTSGHAQIGQAWGTAAANGTVPVYINIANNA